MQLMKHRTENAKRGHLRGRRPVRALLGVLACTTVVAGLLVSPAASAAASGNAQLAGVRAATAAYHDVGTAETAGYLLLPLPCFDKPGVGGMGIHYLKGKLVSSTPTADEPQVLVYEVAGDQQYLVAVEYIVPYALVPTTASAPNLFGQDFHHNDALGLWYLHAWIWRQNPLGMFADYNPKVALCPAHSS
ncbi:MAG TPA: hypothetical protein VNV65_07395 [Candidatus Solibacter sp.]|jgi:hypothetical protein|nr:hypothetical protein [Candidatus Solibacter sp.]